MKKILVLISLCLIATLFLAGCTSNVNQVKTLPTNQATSTLVQATIPASQPTENLSVPPVTSNASSFGTGKDDAKFIETLKSQIENIRTIFDQFSAKMSAKDMSGAQDALTQLQTDVISQKSVVMAMQVSPALQPVQQNYGKAIDSLQVIIDNSQKAISAAMNGQQADADAAYAKIQEATPGYEANMKALAESLLKSAGS